MKKIILIGFMLFPLCFGAFGKERMTATKAVSSETIPENFELEVKLRMRQMTCIVAPRLNEEVKFFLGRYIFKHQHFTGKMLGNAAVYFPVFEKMLREKDMPTDLRALSILESWLDPAATSRVGAGGLWQLMPGTARMYGLTVTKAIDERRDLYRSTEAAINLLSKLHQIYGDWGLALAAYNSGPLRVNNALKKAGAEKEGSSFWTIAPYLPKETQNFVPKFIAINYLLTFYKEHGIKPTFPDLDRQFIDVTKVYDKVTFRDITKITGVTDEALTELNPGYKGKFIPASTRGYNLVLPSRVLGVFNDYMALENAKQKKEFMSEIQISAPEEGEENEDLKYVEMSYTVNEGDDLDFIAYKYNLNKTRIKIWNHVIHSSDLYAGQELTLYVPLQVYLDQLIQCEALECIPAKESFYVSCAAQYSGIDRIMDEMICKYSSDFIWHTFSRFESIQDLIVKYELSGAEELMTLNGLVDPAQIMPGMQIKIPVIDKKMTAGLSGN
jgi:membrane-bound lytic murein transglycosylase D